MTESQISAGDNLDREQVIVTNYQSSGVLGNDSNKWDYLIGYQYETDTPEGCIRRNLATLEGLSSTSAWPLSGASKVFIEDKPYNWITGLVDWSVQKALEDLDAGLTTVENTVGVFIFNETQFIDALNAGKLVLICGAPFTLTGASGAYNLPALNAVEVYGEPLTIDATSVTFNCVVAPQGQINFYNDVYINKASMTFNVASVECALRFRNLYGVNSSTAISLGADVIFVYERLRSTITFAGVGTSTNSFWDNTISSSQLGMKYLKDSSTYDGSIVSAIDDGSTATVSGISSVVMGSVNNSSYGDYNSILGGNQNSIYSNGASVISGGQFNSINSSGSNQVIGGGAGNIISSPDAAILSGISNAIMNSSTDGSSTGGVISGGGFNFIKGSSSSNIGGGYGNFIVDAAHTSASSSIMGGFYNGIDSSEGEAFIGCGTYNLIGCEILATGFNDSGTTKIIEGDPGKLYGDIQNSTKVRFLRNYSANTSGAGGYGIKVDGVIATPRWEYYVVNYSSSLHTFELSHTINGTPLKIEIISHRSVSNGYRPEYVISSVANDGNPYACIIGGEYNNIQHGYNSFIGVGNHNKIVGGTGTILSGYYNLIRAVGKNDTANTVLGGRYNEIYDGYSNIISAGVTNNIGNVTKPAGTLNAILNGSGNSIIGYNNTIINGNKMTISDTCASILTGTLPNNSVILSAGNTTSPSNIISSSSAFIGVGINLNIYSNAESAIIGGKSNVIDGADGSTLINGNNSKIGSKISLSSSAFTVDYSNNQITLSSVYYDDNRIQNYDVVYFTGGSPTNLLANKKFFVCSCTSTSFKLSQISTNKSISAITLDSSDATVTQMVIGKGTSTNNILLSGIYNISYAPDSVLLGGAYNTIGSISSQSVILGGAYHTIEYKAAESFIVGGYANLLETGVSNIITSQACSIIDTTRGTNSTTYELNSMISSIDCTVTDSYKTSVINSSDSKINNGFYCSIINSETCNIYPLVSTGSSLYTGIYNSSNSYTVGVVGNSHIMGAASGVLEIAANSHIYGGGGCVISSFSSDGSASNNCTSDTILQGGSQLINRSIRSTLINGSANQIFGASNHAFVINGGSNVVNYSSYSFVDNGVSNAISGYSYVSYVDFVTAGKPATTPTTHSAIINGAANHIFNASEYCTIVNGGGNTIDNSQHSVTLGTSGTTIYASEYSSVISGGGHEISQCSYSTILNGGGHEIWSTSYGTIIGGGGNYIGTASDYSSILGGAAHTINITTEYSSIINGYQNSIITNGRSNTIMSGDKNILTGGNYITIIGSKEIEIDMTGVTNTTLLNMPDGTTALPTTTYGGPDNTVFTGDINSVANIYAAGYIEPGQALYMQSGTSFNIHSDAAYFYGDVGISGNLVKGSGTFRIPYPTEEKKYKFLYHSFVESPTAGDNIYTYKAIATQSNETVVIELPDYWNSLNENPRAFVQGVETFARAYAKVDVENNTLLVTCESSGEFDVLLIGTRKDPIVKKSWKGIERDE